MLKEYADVDLRECSHENLPSIMNHYDVFWFRLAHQIDESVLGSDVKCKFLVTPVTGIDHIDVDLCRQKGIEIVSLKGETEFLKTIRATAVHIPTFQK